MIPIISSNILNASATTEITNAPLFQSNLSFELNTPSNIHVEIGGKTLTGFNALGSTLQEDDYRLYHARLFFDIEANIYTTYSYDDVFPDARSIGYSTKWLDLYTSQNPDSSLYDWEHTPYYVDYNSYNLGTFDGQGIDGFIDLDVEFIDFTPESLDFGNLQIESTTKVILMLLHKLQIYN